MHQRLHWRLKALEKWLPDETKPHKSLLPEWLVEDLRQQGIWFDASGRPEKSSLQEKASERIANADGCPVIIEIGPGREISAFYRARVFQSNDRLQHAMEHPDTELGPPPAKLATAGRMNAFGISVFYGAGSPDTAIAEVRPPVGSRVLVGRFDLIRPLRLLDVEVLRSVYVKGSLFDPTFGHNAERAKFLGGLSRRITRPVMPADEPFEYLATQVIADFLASKADPTIDGLVYPSVQTSSGKPNVVLFHKAARVERLELPAGTELQSRCCWDYDDEDEEEEIDYWVWESVSQAEAAKDPPKETQLRFDPVALFRAHESDDRTASLRVDTSSLEVHHIREVTFKTDAFSVHRHRIEKIPAPILPEPDPNLADLL
jgi:hypothetical protein